MGENTEVLIVGAGPVGLTMALECARHDVAFRIVDSAPVPSDKSKALAIWSAAQEVFAVMGVVDRMHAEGLKPGGIRVCSHARQLAGVPFDGRVDSPYPDLLILPQSLTERILLDRLGELGHAVERPFEWVNAKEENGLWLSTLRGGDGREFTVGSRFLVGCDGAHSAVRHFVGATFHGRAMPECFVLCDAEISAPRPIPQDVHLFVSSQGPMPVFPIRERVWRIISSRGPAEGTAPPTLEEMQEHVDCRGPGNWKLSNPEWLACFKVSERKVDRFRHGNILLAGDAAHIHSPAGGQGMNTGVQDAFNLAWKLGAILRQGASPECLLESYHDERSPVAADVIATAGFRLRAAVLSRGPLAWMRNALAVLVGRSESARTRLVHSLSGTGIRYQSGPAILKDDRWHEDWLHHGFPPGLRIRDVRLVSEGIEISLLHEVMKSRRHTLLLFSGRKPNYRDADLLEGLRTEAANATTLMTSLAIWQGDHAPDDSWLTDPDGSVHRRFGVDQPSACVVRPDGVVMARSQPAVAALVTDVLARLRN
ncbi:MAG: FAD-dependent monooxygenase [Terrimicrobiaceae bacterium]